MNESEQVRRWLELMSDEEWAFVRRFVLASGSLKDLAAQYGVTYPTIRLRLDRLIAKIQALESTEKMSDMERLLRALAAEGRVDPDALRLLLKTHAKERRSSHGSPMD